MALNLTFLTVCSNIPSPNTTPIAFFPSSSQAGIEKSGDQIGSADTVHISVLLCRGLCHAAGELGDGVDGGSDEAAGDYNEFHRVGEVHKLGRLF